MSYISRVFEKLATPTDIDIAFSSGAEFIEATQIVLRSVQEEEAKLNMRSWCNAIDIDYSVIEKKRKPSTARQVMHNCGTSACVIGWCASHPLFLEKGLYLNEEGIPFLLCEDNSVKMFCLEDPRTPERYSKLSSSWRIALFGPSYSSRTENIRRALGIEGSTEDKGLPSFFTEPVVTIDDYLEASQWVLDNHKDKL